MSDRLRAAAKQAISLMDLTSLNDSDTEQSIKALCHRADTPAGPVAAVCVYPRFVAAARATLDALELSGRVKLATVANFPDGGQALDQVQSDIRQALNDGAEEIDLVFPWQALLDGDSQAGKTMLAASRKTSGSKLLKVILETGQLHEPGLIRQAAELAIEGGADFLKTSTGKVKINASLSAATVLLETIRDSGRDIGFKASGGIRHTIEATAYLTLAEQMMGPDWINPAHFRFGASSLLDDLLSVLNGEPCDSETGNAD